MREVGIFSNQFDLGFISEPKTFQKFFNKIKYSVIFPNLNFYCPCPSLSNQFKLYFWNLFHSFILISQEIPLKSLENRLTLAFLLIFKNIQNPFHLKVFILFFIQLKQVQSPVWKEKRGFKEEGKNSTSKSGSIFS